MTRTAARRKDDDTPKPDHPGRWGPVSSVVVTVGIYFSSQIVAAVVLSLVPLLFMSADQLEDWMSRSVYAQFASVVLVEAATLWLLAAFLKSKRATWRDIGLVHPRKKDIGFAALGVCLYVMGALIALTIVPALIPSIDSGQSQELGFDKAIRGPILGLVFISLVILPALVEEIMARGFLYTGLRSRLSLLSAGFITSLLFGVAHLQIGSGNPLLWIAALDTFVLSAVLVYLREKSGSLWSPIAVHMLKNTLAFTYLFIFKVI